MFDWLRSILKKVEVEKELVIAPRWMYPVGYLFYHSGHKRSGYIAGIYRITRHQEDSRLESSVICHGVLELPLSLPKCAAARLQSLLNQTECKCEDISEYQKKFHNEVEY